MAQPVIKHFLHIVFTTKGQKELINQEVEDKIIKEISKIFGHHQTHILAIGAHLNHIHILCNLSRDIALKYLIREAKFGSEIWIQKEYPELTDFKWQDGYAAFSISPSEVDSLTETINKHHDYHQDLSFEDEYAALLKKYNVDYRAYYLW